MGTTTIERRPGLVSADPLEQAIAWLRMAATVPYEAREPSVWLTEFQACVSGAREALARPASEPRALPPRLLPFAGRVAEAREQVTRLAEELFTDAYIATEPDLLTMVDLAECAKALEFAIERLRERRSDLLFESTYRDLGGGG